MLETILINALGLTVFLAGFMFGWKGHEMWMRKADIQASATKEEEAENLYRAKDGKFYTHKVARYEDD